MSAIENLFVSACFIYLAAIVYFFIVDTLWNGWGRW